MKLTDGMFLSTFREVAKDYPAIEADDCIIDALCMKPVSYTHLDVYKRQPVHRKQAA